MTEAFNDKEAKGKSGEHIYIYLSGEAYEILEQIAQDQDREIIDVLEEAVGMERWKQEIKKEGGRVIIERRGGKRSELVLD